MLNFMLYLFPLLVTCAVKLRYVSFVINEHSILTISEWQ